MSESSPFSVQLLSKIGAPLVRAIESAGAQEGDTKSAEDMAKMLGIAVEMSIMLHEKLDLKEDEKQADETRTALAVVAAELIAEFYGFAKKLPEENDKNRMMKSLESVLGFADKFSKSQEHASRLSTLGKGQVLFDETQPKLVILQSVTDIVNVVTDFPFGQSENKLIQDIVERLEKDAQELTKEAKSVDKLSELIILKSLTGLYADCHRNETKKISGSDQEGTPSLDPVWASYETKLAMMSALVGGSDDMTPMPATPVAQESPMQTSVSEAPADPPAAASAGGGGPMGFFAKKPAGEEPLPNPEPVSKDIPPEPPPLTHPPEAPAESPIEIPEESPPPSEPPPEPEKPAGEAGNPMSFFKGPPKKEEGEE